MRKKSRSSSSNYRSLYLRKWLERLKYIELHAIIWLTKRFVAKNKHVKVLKLTIKNRGNLWLPWKPKTTIFLLTKLLTCNSYEQKGLSRVSSGKYGTCQRLGGNKVSSFADQTALVWSVNYFLNNANQELNVHRVTIMRD